MIFAEPALSREDRKVLEILEKQRRRLQFETLHTPRRWHGALRRSAFARAIRGSNAIEGYNVTMDEAMAAVDDEALLDERTEATRAVQGYRRAMTWILQVMADPYFHLDRQFLKSLHFMMCEFDLNAHPGRWRPGAVRIVDHPTGAVVYEAPDADMVESLAGELVGYLNERGSESVLVAGAMAHLNLAMIHPFKDGNGRMARALQTLVLAREGLVHPLFSSIEEWLGRNTRDYYDVLAEVGQGRWAPSNNALPWVRFCLRAHYQQANTMIRRNEEYEALFTAIEALAERRRLNERTIVPLFNAALGMRLTNARYQRETDESSHIAGRDLKLLADLTLLVPHGEKRGRHYLPGPDLVEARARTRRARIALDPYRLPEVSAGPGPRLPGM